MLAGFAPAWGSTEEEAFDDVARLFASRCALSGCHVGPRPKMKMSLERGSIYRSTIQVPSRTEPSVFRVAPGDPEASLLYRKLLPAGEGQYHGNRMPRLFPPLEETEMEIVRTWIESFPEERWGPVQDRGPAAPSWSFQGSFLANLPTPERLGKKGFQFQLAHRFRGAARDAGLEELFGIDTGAWVSIGLAYGISRRWEVGLRHSTYLQQEEGYFKVGILEQGKGSGC